MTRYGGTVTAVETLCHQLPDSTKRGSSQRFKSSRARKECLCTLAPLQIGGFRENASLNGFGSRCAAACEKENHWALRFNFLKSRKTTPRLIRLDSVRKGKTDWRAFADPGI
jgi:hypothetical protein